MENDSNKQFNVLKIILIIIFCLILICCGSFIYIQFFSKEEFIPIEKILLESKEINITYGEEKVIKVNFLPENATNKTLIWSSSDLELVSISDDGKIKLLKNVSKEAMITVKTFDGKVQEQIRVITKSVSENVKVTGITVDKKEISLEYGKKIKLNVSVIPSSATNKKVKWSSSNNNLVSVDSNGNLTINKNEDGSAIITVITEDGNYKATTKINVKKVNITPVKVEELKLNKTTVNLKYNQSTNIIATILPVTATNKKINWISSDERVVTVDSNGKVTAKNSNVGIATITATTEDGNFSKQVTVKIFPTGDYVNFKGGRNYSDYKTNIMLYREKAIMQSFAIYNNYLYIAQQQGTTKGPYFSKININDIRNEKGEGQRFQNQVAILKDYGHAAVMDIEITNNIAYMWTGCSIDGAKVAYHCRFKLDDLKFSKPPIVQDPVTSVKSLGSTLFALDSDNRTFVLMTGTQKNHIFKVYNLDDYIKNKEKATLINTLTVNHGNNFAASRQGIEVVGNYIYSYEGNLNNSSDKMHVVYLSVFTLDGQTLIYRRPINYPNDDYVWEPEGIKVYNNKIYIGFGRQDKETLIKTAHIFVLD